MSKFEFIAESRTDHGKAVARRMRRENDRVPAVVYGAGKEAQSISLQHKDILHALENEAVFSTILKLVVDGKEEQVVLKDIQRHSHKPKITHVDFLRVKAKEKITMHVPLHFIGEEEAPGVKAGGKLTKSYIELEIVCLPANLPEFIEVDVSKMELDHVFHLSDIKLPSGVALTIQKLDDEHNHPVVSCHVPRMSQEDIEAEQHEAELAEEASAESAAEHEVEAAAEGDAEAKSDDQAEGDDKAKDAE